MNPPKKKSMIIATLRKETQVAIMAGKTLESMHIERDKQESIHGNIYLGKVARVLPGIQSAFIEIGSGRTGFLHAADFEGFATDDTELPQLTGSDDGTHKVILHRDVNDHFALEQHLKKNQVILVQVVKDPIGTKGARLRSQLSLPGRFGVFLPNAAMVGVSRKIVDRSLRERLSKDLTQIVSNGHGMIARTLAVDASLEELKSDFDRLCSLWEAIEKKILTAKAPTLIYQDLDILGRVIRDVYTSEISEVIVDSTSTKKTVKQHLDQLCPGNQTRVRSHRGKLGIFEQFGVAEGLARALSRTVPLKSGGSIVIDETEALTAIDVNTGKFVGKASPRETILRTNIEACDLIAEQTRIRNLGGIIVIDFIDMKDSGDRDTVFKRFSKLVEHDRSKVSLLHINELGLLHMTRKRTGPSLKHQLLERCSHCEGLGWVARGEESHAEKVS